MTMKWTLGQAITFITAAALACQVLAKPMDGHSAEALIQFGGVLQKEGGKRQLSPEETASLVALANRDSVDSRMVAAYFLAFADDDASLATLNALAGNSNKIVSGCAVFSLRWRSLRTGKDQPPAAAVAKAYRETTESYARIMLANRLAVDYAKEGPPLIAELLRDETDPVVRCDLLYYIVTYGTREDCQIAAALQWDEKVARSERLSFLLGVITPKRSEDANDNSTAELLRKLHERLDGK